MRNVVFGIILGCFFSTVIIWAQIPVPGGAASSFANPFMQQLTAPPTGTNQGDATQAGKELAVPQYNAGAAMASSDYILGPGDAILIYVWGVNEKSFTAWVTPEGKIFIPVVGDIKVSGLTVSKIEQVLNIEFSKYVRDTRVSVALVNLRTIQVQVLGQVKNPGVFSLYALDRISQAFGASGGPTELASIRSVQLTRKGDLVATLDLYKYFIWGDQTQNPKLEAGDIIYIPVNNNTVRVVGQVWKPGTYEVKEGERLMDVITMAGGITPLAAMDTLKIENIAEPEVIRSISMRRLILEHNDEANIVVKNGDIVTIATTPTTITVVGQVQKGGTFPYEPGTVVSYYLGLAGGYGERASTGNIKVNRWGGKTVRASERTAVQSGDVIVVGEMQIKGWRDYISVMGQVATLFFIVWQVSRSK